jgi:hypothetical protein
MRNKVWLKNYNCNTRAFALTAAVTVHIGKSKFHIFWWFCIGLALRNKKEKHCILVQANTRCNDGLCSSEFIASNDMMISKYLIEDCEGKTSWPSMRHFLAYGGTEKYRHLGEPVSVEMFEPKTCRVLPSQLRH